MGIACTVLLVTVFVADIKEVCGDLDFTTSLDTEDETVTLPKLKRQIKPKKFDDFTGKTRHLIFVTKCL